MPPPRRHPLHFPCFERAALVAIVNRPVENKRDRLKTCMRVRPADGTVANVQMIVHQCNERIVVDEVFRRDDLRRQVPGTDKSRHQRWHRDDSSDATSCGHGDLFLSVCRLPPADAMPPSPAPSAPAPARAPDPPTRRCGTASGRARRTARHRDRPDCARERSLR